MARTFHILTLALMGLLIGCDAEVDNWNARILSQSPNPNNGAHNFTSQRAEVIDDHCGFFRRSCVSARLLDETGFANAQGGRFFTYLGDPRAISISWKDAKTLQVRCRPCDAKRIERQMKEVNFTHIEYEL
jgi:hypothetical protein